MAKLNCHIDHDISLDVVDFVPYQDIYIERNFIKRLSKDA